MFQSCRFYEAGFVPPGVLAWLWEMSPVWDWGKDKMKLYLQGHY